MVVTERVIEPELTRKGRRKANVLGTGFTVLGVFGLFLPFLQGLLFILVGLLFFSMTSKRIKGWTEGMKNKYPRMASIFSKA